MSQIKQLLQQHKQGYSVKTIARNFGISKNTVKSYEAVYLLPNLDDPYIILTFCRLQLISHPLEKWSTFRFFQLLDQHNIIVKFAHTKIGRRMKKIIDALIEFRNERDWEQFHNPKDLALAINVEAGELLELFLWKSPEEAKFERVKEELADVFAFAFLLAEKYNLDVEEIVLDKIKKNGEKYPVEKAKGTAKKYNEL